MVRGFAAYLHMNEFGVYSLIQVGKIYYWDAVVAVVVKR